MSFILRENFAFTATFTTKNHIVTNDQNTNMFRTYGFVEDRLIHFCAIFINPLVYIVAIPIFLLIQKFNNKDSTFFEIALFGIISISKFPFTLINNIFGVFFPNNANNMAKIFEDKTTIQIGLMETQYFRFNS
jgi:hypothetical protein